MTLQERLALFQSALKGIEKLELIYPEYPPFVSIRNQLQYLIDLVGDPNKLSDALLQIDFGLITAREVETRSDATANLLYAASAEVEEMQKDARLRKIPLEELYLKLKGYYLSRGLTHELAEDSVKKIRDNMKDFPWEQQRQGLEQSLEMVLPKPAEKSSLEDLYLRTKNYYTNSGMPKELAEETVNKIREGMKPFPENLIRQGFELSLKTKVTLASSRALDADILQRGILDQGLYERIQDAFDYDAASTVGWAQARLNLFRSRLTNGLSVELFNPETQKAELVTQMQDFETFLLTLFRGLKNIFEHTFTVKPVSDDRGTAANYNYEFYRGSTLIARYWHDFRGDEHGITFFDGATENCPVGKMTDFLEGGGPTPVRLSTKAIIYLANFCNRPKQSKLYNLIFSFQNSLENLISVIRRILKVYETEGKSPTLPAYLKWKNTAIPLLSADIQATKEIIKTWDEKVAQISIKNVAEKYVHLAKNFGTFSSDFGGSEFTIDLNKYVSETVISADVLSQELSALDRNTTEIQPEIASIWKNFKTRSLEFSNLLEKKLRQKNLGFSRLEITLAESLPSLGVQFQLNGHLIELGYSEHHLDYADGISVSVDGAFRSSFKEFGINLLEKCRDADSKMDRFVESLILNLPKGSEKTSAVK